MPCSAPPAASDCVTASGSEGLASHAALLQQNHAGRPLTQTLTFDLLVRGSQPWDHTKHDEPQTKSCQRNSHALSCLRDDAAQHTEDVDSIHLDAGHTGRRLALKARGNKERDSLNRASAAASQWCVREASRSVTATTERWLLPVNGVSPTWSSPANERRIMKAGLRLNTCNVGAKRYGSMTEQPGATGRHTAMRR